MKRALAYSSVENVGLITLAFGLAFWASGAGRSEIAALAVAGALLHLWNHTLMKGLMFLGVGSVLHGTGTKDLERLGGVLRRMPRTGILLILGSVAIGALPPMNGFVSEWLVYVGLARGAVAAGHATGVLLFVIIAIVSLVGGLAALAFVRLIGTALLGSARSGEAAQAHESPPLMIAPMAVLGVLSVGSALAPGTLLSACSGVAAELLGGKVDSASAWLSPLARINLVVWILVGCGGVLAALLVHGNGVDSATTWGCGYPHATPRMQYTASSFSELLAERLIPRPLRPQVAAPTSQATGAFPTATTFATRSDDPLTRGIYEPFLARWADRFARLRWMQQGVLHVYLVYILAALLAGLGWSSLRAWGAP